MGSLRAAPEGWPHSSQRAGRSPSGPQPCGTEGVTSPCRCSEWTGSFVAAWDGGRFTPWTRPAVTSGPKAFRRSRA
jgi:hypothetical protein